ncbi:MAG: radical SAM protein [Archaeoglobaceae archaeon]
MEFETLLNKVLEEPKLEDCCKLLEKAKSFERVRKLLDLASKIRDEKVGRILKLDSFVYPVKKCVMEKYCIYCSNYVEKFRLEPLSPEEFSTAIDFIKDCGMKRITLEGGYNPDNSKIPNFIVMAKKSGLETILDIYPISQSELRTFKALGVSEIYASLEIPDSKLFSHFKPEESFEKRLELAKEVCRNNLGLSSTIMIGLPNTGYEIWIKGLFMLREFECLKHCAISSFNPVYGTPLQNAEPLSPVSVAKFVAIARILLPEKDISACGSVGLQSLPLMLLAGANRAYLGAYVCRARTQKGFADELEDVFKPDYEAKVRNGLVFANPSEAVERICRDFGFEVD